MFSNILSRWDSDEIWNKLLMEGNRTQTSSSLSSSDQQPLIAMEVGMQLYRQCHAAAKYGFHVRCIEPSPQSYNKIVKAYNSETAKNPVTTSRIQLYNMAASHKSHETVPFYASGGTGDHVGEFDMWNMKPGPPQLDAKYPTKHKKLIEVSTVTLDDIIENKIKPTHSSNEYNKVVNQNNNNVFLLKVDTQGFEPAVFKGLTSSLQQHKIKYLLFEYWPKGMDLISNNVHEESSRCKEPIIILNNC